MVEADKLPDDEELVERVFQAQPYAGHLADSTEVVPRLPLLKHAGSR